MHDDDRLKELQIGPQGRFAAPPWHLEHAFSIPTITTRDIKGLEENWCLPVATHFATTIADVRLPALDHHTLVYHRGGAPAQRLLARGRRLFAHVGSVSLTSAGALTDWHSDGPLTYTHVFLRPEFLSHLALATGEVDFDGMLADVGLTLRGRDLQALVKAYVNAAESAGTTTLEMESRALALGAALLRSRAGLGGRARRLDYRISPLPAWRLRRLDDFAEAHLDQPLRLTDLAGTVGQSPHHFIRTLRAATGLSPHQWLTHKRIARARVLLARTDLPLIQVALECGFGTQQHFTTVFRQATGVTPGAFRRTTAH